MKTISLIQPNFPMSIDNDKFFLPYSAGAVWSYLDSFNDNKYSLNQLVFNRDPVEKLAHRLAGDEIVGFSTYMWNRQYNLTLAKRLKEISPNTVIVFGGPEMEILDYKFFERFPFIDMHVVNEGELTFKSIVDNLDDWDSIPNIIYNNKGKTINTHPGLRIMDLKSLPSPYLTGVFDKLIHSHPEYSFIATFETNRGCPYQCTFCDWGSLTYNKIRKFPLDRVFSEIEWFFNNPKISGIDLADANFGIFVERDQSIVDKFISETKRTDRRVQFNSNFAKNQNVSVFHMIRKLAEETGSTRYVTIALQSLDEEVLETIKRKNLATNKIEEIFELLTKFELVLKIEIIIGLPSDTLEKFKKTVYDLFEISSDIQIHTYKLIALNNAELTIKEQGGVKWRKIKNFVDNSVDSIDETFSWVYSTDSMSHDEIISAIIFAMFIQTFHVNGFSHVLAIYAHRNGVSYKHFYDTLLERCYEDVILGKYFTNLRKAYKDWYQTGESCLETIKGISFGANNDMSHLTAKIHAENLFDHVFTLLEDHMKLLNLYNEELLKIQRYIPIHFNKQDDYPLNLKYNNKNIKLLNLNATEKTYSLFINSIHFKRDSGFGKAKLIGLEHIQ